MRRRAGPGRRPKPDPDAQHAAVRARHAGRYQSHRGLRGIEDRGREVRIGALVRHAEVLDSAIVAARVPLLALAIPYVAHMAVRNRGTTCGSLALADPAAEMPAVAVALDAYIVLCSRGGHPHSAGARFLPGSLPDRPQRRRDDCGGVISGASADEVFGFAELNRRHGDFAVVGAAAKARKAGSALQSLTVVIFGSEAKPLLSTRAAEATIARARPTGRSASSPRDRRGDGPDRTITKAAATPSAGRPPCCCNAFSRTCGDERSMPELHDIAFTLNGEPVAATVAARQHLADFLRQALRPHRDAYRLRARGLRRLQRHDRRPFGAQLPDARRPGQRRRVETIEGLTASGAIADLQHEFVRRNALQCGYCTPGILATAAELLARGQADADGDSRRAVRQLLPLHRLSGDRRCDRGGASPASGRQA